MVYGLVALPVCSVGRRLVCKSRVVEGGGIPRQIRMVRSSPPDAMSPFGSIDNEYTKDVCAESEWTMSPSNVHIVISLSGTKVSTAPASNRARTCR